MLSRIVIGLVPKSTETELFLPHQGNQDPVIEHGPSRRQSGNSKIHYLAGRWRENIILAEIYSASRRCRDLSGSLFSIELRVSCAMDLRMVVGAPLAKEYLTQ